MHRGCAGCATRYPASYLSILLSLSAGVAHVAMRVGHRVVVEACKAMHPGTSLLLGQDVFPSHGWHLGVSLIGLPWHTLIWPEVEIQHGRMCLCAPPTLTHFHPFSCSSGGSGWWGRAAPVVTPPLAPAASCLARRNIYWRHFKSQSENRHLFRFDFKRSQVPSPNYSALKFQRQGGDRVCNNPALFTPCNLQCGFCSRCQGVTFQRELKNSKHWAPLGEQVVFFTPEDITREPQPLLTQLPSFHGGRGKLLSMNSDCSESRSQTRNMENVSVTGSPLVQAWRDANVIESNSSLFVNVCKYCFVSLGYCKSSKFLLSRSSCSLLKTPIGFKLASLKVTLVYYSLLNPPPTEKKTLKASGIRSRAIYCRVCFSHCVCHALS